MAVIRRGPSSWCRVYRWDPARRTIEPGSWFHGTIYPQRCDLSPDGRWLVYFALKGNAGWQIGQTYLAVSRLPWLNALVAWSTCGTWTRGLHFTDDRGRFDPADPDHGDAAPLRRRFGLAGTSPVTFAVERRRGWQETPDTPPRSSLDAWDERRADEVTMVRAHPRIGDLQLLVSGRHAAFRDHAPAWGRPRYRLGSRTERTQLEEAQWADWSATGDLLVATTAGALEIRSQPFGRDDVVWRYPMASERPDPEPPPPEAGRW